MNKPKLKHYSDYEIGMRYGVSFPISLEKRHREISNRERTVLLMSWSLARDIPSHSIDYIGDTHALVFYKERFHSHTVRVGKLYKRKMHVIVYTTNFISGCRIKPSHTEDEKIWPLCRGHFQMYFRRWKIVHFDSNFTYICLKCSSDITLA